MQVDTINLILSTNEHLRLELHQYTKLMRTIRLERLLTERIQVQQLYNKILIFLYLFQRLEQQMFGYRVNMHHKCFQIIQQQIQQYLVYLTFLMEQPHFLQLMLMGPLLSLHWKHYIEVQQEILYYQLCKISLTVTYHPEELDNQQVITCSMENQWTNQWEQVDLQLKH